MCRDSFSLTAGNFICAETPQALLIPSTRVGTLDWVSPQQPAFYLPGCQLLCTPVTSIVSFFPSGQLIGFSEPEDLNLELRAILCVPRNGGKFLQPRPSRLWLSTSLTFVSGCSSKLRTDIWLLTAWAFVLVSLGSHGVWSGLNSCLMDLELTLTSQVEPPILRHPKLLCCSTPFFH